MTTDGTNAGSNTNTDGTNASSNTNTGSDINATITEFVRYGYDNARFSVDKHERYTQALNACLATITPPAEALRVDSPIPAEGMAHIVNAVYTQLDAHRDAVALLAAESLHPVLDSDTATAVMESSELGLHLDRVLLRGQEAGVFRPGIAAQDVFYLLIALSFFRLNHRHLLATTTRVDALSTTNSAGIRRLVVDAVLSFLTSNIADSEHESYLVTSSEDSDSSGLGVYWD